MLCHHALCLTAFLSNTVPMALTAALFFRHTLENTDTALGVGIGALIAAIVLALLSHFKLNHHPAAWLVTLLFAGVSKGSFTAVILYHTGLWENISQGNFSSLLLLSFAITLMILLLCLSALHLSPIKRHPQWFMLPVLLLFLIVTVVLLILYHNAFFTVLLLNVITLILCFGARILEFDEDRELRSYLLVASLTYALLLLFVAIFILSMLDGDCDAECCECCDCSGADTSSGRKKKK